MSEGMRPPPVPGPFGGCVVEQGNGVPDGVAGVVYDDGPAVLRELSEPEVLGPLGVSPGTGCTWSM